MQSKYCVSGYGHPPAATEGVCKKAHSLQLVVPTVLSACAAVVCSVMPEPVSLGYCCVCSCYQRDAAGGRPPDQPEQEPLPRCQRSKQWCRHQHRRLHGR
jgi:hypothetical protein